MDLYTLFSKICVLNDRVQTLRDSRGTTRNDDSSAEMKFIMLQRSRLRHFVVFWACSLWWGIVLLANVQGQRDDVRSVAIVGAGIGGSSASFFLRNVAGDDMEIHVFEQDDKAGGRTSVSGTYTSNVLIGVEPKNG